MTIDQRSLEKGPYRYRSLVLRSQDTSDPIDANIAKLQIFELLNPRVMREVHQSTLSADSQDDIKSQTWKKVFDYLPRFKYHNDEKFVNWVLKILKNTITDAARREKKYAEKLPTISLDEPISGPNGETVLRHETISADRLKPCDADLDEREQEIRKQAIEFLEVVLRNKEVQLKLCCQIILGELPESSLSDGQIRAYLRHARRRIEDVLECIEDEELANFLCEVIKR